jgi:hypothetical protein
MVQFFEIGFLFAYETAAIELAARILGFLDGVRAEHRLPRTAASIDETAARERELRARLGGAFDRCYEVGKADNLAAMERDLDAALSAALTKVG